MKNFFLLGALLLVGCINVQAGSDDLFLEKFQTCSSYSSTGEVAISGLQVVSSKNILGWRGDKCHYEEKINLMDTDSVVSCEFSKQHIDEIVSVMKAYELIQQYSGKKDDFSNLEQAQSNPAVTVWHKYLSDPSVCSVQTLKSSEN